MDGAGTSGDPCQITFNVTLVNTNVTVLLEINNTNITATSLSVNTFSASYTFTRGGTYPYTWYSWGNGSVHNLDVSQSMNFRLN